MNEFQRCLEEIRVAAGKLRQMVEPGGTLHHQDTQSMADSMREDADLLRSLWRSLQRRSLAAYQPRIGPPPEPLVPPPAPPLFSGHAPHNYARYKRELEPIFSVVFPRWTPISYETEILPLATIPVPTIHRWRGKWMHDPYWRPWNMRENHGSHHRLFTDAQEDEIAEEIRHKYVDKGVLFTSSTFAAIAMGKWQELGRDPAQFKCSDKYISGFKKRNAFSSRKCHVKRRNPVGEEQDVAVWVQTIKDLVAYHRENGTLDLVVNCDETSWRVVPSGLVTWAPTGQDGVSIRVNGNDKDCLTVLASVTAGSRKLPLLAIAKGKTKRVEQSQLGTDDALIRDHSESGWSTTATFQRYLEWLSRQYCIVRPGVITPERPIELILDCYSVHRSDEVKQYAAGLGIRLWFIPAGHTDELQPLDRAVFGAIKAMFRRKFEALLRARPNQQLRKAVAMDLLSEIWTQLAPVSIDQGWSIYEEDFGPSEDDDEYVEWE